MGFLSQQHAQVIDELKHLFPFYKIEIEHNIGNRLFLDIFIPDLSVGIEVNGVQHYEFVPFFHGTLENFEEYKMLDMKKLRMCNELGIGLYIIKHNEIFNRDHFMSFIHKFLIGDSDDTSGKQ